MHRMLDDRGLTSNWCSLSSTREAEELRSYRRMEDLSVDQCRVRTTEERSEDTMEFVRAHHVPTMHWPHIRHKRVPRV